MGAVLLRLTSAEVFLTIVTLLCCFVFSGCVVLRLLWAVRRWRRGVVRSWPAGWGRSIRWSRSLWFFVHMYRRPDTLVDYDWRLVVRLGCRHIDWFLLCWCAVLVPGRLPRGGAARRLGSSGVGRLWWLGLVGRWRGFVGWWGWLR